MSVYGTSIQKAKVITEFSELNRLVDIAKQDVLNEAKGASVSLDMSTKEFTKKADQFMDQVKVRRDVRKMFVEGIALVSLGLGIVGLGTFAVGYPVAGIILIVRGLLFSLVVMIPKIADDSDVRKLMDLRDKIQQMEHKVKDKKDKEVLRSMIERLDKEQERRISKVDL